MAAPTSIGVDNGGTWIRMVGLNSKGRCVWTFKKRSPTVDKLPHFLKKHLHRFKDQLNGLAVGSRGVWKPSKRRTVKRALHGVAKNIVVMSDVEAAWMAAFGKNKEGIVVISGTGSIAYGQKKDGTIARAGGFGPEKGDEGSGYWIGKEWLQRTGRVKDLRKSVRNIASIAPKVLARAKRKDPIALGIIREAQDELATLVGNLAHRLRIKRVSVSCTGSVFADSWFQSGFFRALNPLDMTRRSVKTDAAMALARSIIGHGAG